MTMLSNGPKKTREPCVSLPQGWFRETSVRERGVSVGRLDVHYVSPAGKKIRSKVELLKEIGDGIDLTNFDFASGKVVTALIRGHRAGGSKKGSKTNEKSKSNANSSLNSLVPPIRQTASIFKQPVTVLKTHKTDVKKNIKTDKEKPRQLLWERRLENISPYNSTEDEVMMQLPSIIQSLTCFGDTESTQTVLASLSTALHLDKKPVVGQIESLDDHENPVRNLNTEQPLVQEVHITDQQIFDQEKKVIEARNKLAAAMRALGQMSR